MTDRKSRIDEIVANCISDERLSWLKRDVMQGITFPADLLTIHRIFSGFPAEPGPVRDLTWNLMQELRTHGLVSACPNNDSGSLVLKAWNFWVDGFDPHDVSDAVSGFGEYVTFDSCLFETPGFNVLSQVLCNTMSMACYRTNDADYRQHLKDIGFSEIPEYLPDVRTPPDHPFNLSAFEQPLTESAFDKVLSRVPNAVKRTLNGDSDVHVLKRRFHTWRWGEATSGPDPLNPVLTICSSGNPVPFSKQETPNIEDESPSP